jgi:hypothetical protein
MKVHCDKVLTTDDFDAEYASWKGRTLTVMGDYIKVSQLGLQPRYFDTIYIFEKTGVLIGFKYDSPVNECYLTTQDGQESECYADAMPFLFEDCQHVYAVVKRSYRNVDLKRQVIGLGIIDTATLTSLDPKFTWPIWEGIDSIHNGAIVIRKNDSSYGMSTLDKFPACNLVSSASSIKKEDGEENVYIVTKLSMGSPETQRCDFSKKLSKIKLPR